MKNKTREIVLIALFIALAIVLDLIKEMLPFLNMPSGGSINIALIPVVVGSFVLGYKKGIVIGLMWWLLTFVMGNIHHFAMYIFIQKMELIILIGSFEISSHTPFTFS